MGLSPLFSSTDRIHFYLFISDKSGNEPKRDRFSRVSNLWINHWMPCACWRIAFGYSVKSILFKS